MKHKLGLPSRPVVLAAVLLVALVWGVFFPLLSFDFVEFDVYRQVIDNPHIKGLTAENVKHILTSRCITSYYPIRTLTYAADYEIWGLNARGFKLTNLLIHTANVLLVFWMVLRLFRLSAAPGPPTGGWREAGVAAFCGGLFAIHPVVVEPVSWVAGREELLMTLGALGCLHFHVTARRLAREEGRTAAALACHGGAAFCCAAACLSNAVGAVIPMLIVAWDLVGPLRPRIWSIVTGTAPLGLIGAATIVIKRIGESDGEMLLPRAFSVERGMLVLQVYWLNLKTLVWPSRLSLYYDWADLDRVQLALGGGAVLLTGLLVWRLRRHRLAVFGMAWFLVALGPASQIMPHHIQRADRFMYLPLVGPAVVLAFGFRRLVARLKPSTAAAGAVAAGLVLALVAVNSAGQVQTWRNSLSVWRACLVADPNNARAHDALADNLVEKGRSKEAVPHYELVLRWLPDCVETLAAYAQELALGDRELRDYERAIRLARRACDLTQWKSSRIRRTLAMAYASLAVDMEDRGNYAQAIEFNQRAIRADPSCAFALFNLALLRAACPDEPLRRPQEAVRLAEEGWRLMKTPDATGWMILATAYLRAEQYHRAAMATEKALELTEAAGNQELSEKLRGQLEFCREHSR